MGMSAAAGSQRCNEGPQRDADYRRHAGAAHHLHGRDASHASGSRRRATRISGPTSFRTRSPIPTSWCSTSTPGARLRSTSSPSPVTSYLFAFATSSKRVGQDYLPACSAHAPLWRGRRHPGRRSRKRVCGSGRHRTAGSNGGRRWRRQSLNRSASGSKHGAFVGRGA